MGPMYIETSSISRNGHVIWVNIFDKVRCQGYFHFSRNLDGNLPIAQYIYIYHNMNFKLQNQVKFLDASKAI